MRATYSIDMALKARELAERGLPDYDIAHHLGISLATLYRWKHEHNEFFWAIRIARLRVPRTRGSGNVRKTPPTSAREQEFLRRIEHLRHRGIDITMLRMFAYALCTRVGLTRLAKVAKASKLPREVEEIMEEQVRELSRAPEAPAPQRATGAPYPWRDRDLKDLAKPNRVSVRIVESLHAESSASLECGAVGNKRPRQPVLGLLGSGRVR
jgi:hypothetical protein